MRKEEKREGGDEEDKKRDNTVYSRRSIKIHGRDESWVTFCGLLILERGTTTMMMVFKAGRRGRSWRLYRDLRANLVEHCKSSVRYQFSIHLRLVSLPVSSSMFDGYITGFCLLWGGEEGERKSLLESAEAGIRVYESFFDLTCDRCWN